MRKCKRCNKVKDESQFYLKGHIVNGTYYTNYSGQCKECVCEVAKLIRLGIYKKKKGKIKVDMNWDNKTGGVQTTDTRYEEKKCEDLEHPDLWVVRNLKCYGNCYINGRHDLDFIEEKLGCKLRVKPVAKGNILEVIKE